MVKKVGTSFAIQVQLCTSKKDQKIKLQCSVSCGIKLKLIFDLATGNIHDKSHKIAKVEMDSALSDLLGFTKVSMKFKRVIANCHSG